MRRLWHKQGLLWYNRIMSLKQWFFISLGLILVWFFYLERNILSTFILAGIFAYIFNPIITFLSKACKIPRSVGIFVIYSIILGVVLFIGALLIRQVTNESLDLNKVINITIDSARIQAKTLPAWLSPTVLDFLSTFKSSRFVHNLNASIAIPSFSKAISRVVSFMIFLFSSFYFLKDGENFINKMVAFIPHKYKVDVEILLRKINTILSSYLRGQLLLVAFVAATVYMSLLIVGVRFALTLAIFAGFAEIVPIVGPIVAGASAVIVMLMTGNANFGLTSLDASLILVGVYFILRYFEDYFVVPHVMERITKLPPFIIFFAVVAGGHIAGILGLILAVPVAAILRLLLEFSLDKIVRE